MPTRTPPPPRPEPLTLAVKGLRVVVPTAALVLLALILAPGLAYLVIPGGNVPTPGNGPADAPPAWAVATQAPVLGALATVALAELPSAIPSQRTPPCDPDLERPLRGACWVPVDVEKCPKGKAYVNDKGPDADGKCYARAMKAARSPTSGEPHPAPVASDGD